MRSILNGWQRRVISSMIGLKVKPSEVRSNQGLGIRV